MLCIFEFRMISAFQNCSKFLNWMKNGKWTTLKKSSLNVTTFEFVCKCTNMQSLDSAIFSPKCMWEFLMFLFLAKQVWKKCNIRKLEEITQKYIPLLVHLNALALAVQMIFGLFPILKFPIIGAFIHFSSSLCIMLNGRVGKHAKDKPRCIVAVIVVCIHYSAVFSVLHL